MSASSEAGRPPALVYEHNFCRIERVDGMQVSLGYDLNRDRWPWLALPPDHPVLVEKYQYFSAVTAGWAVFDRASSAHSALTKLVWTCEAASVQGEHATRGRCTLWQNERDMGYELVTHTEAGQAVVTFRGEGFAFADRDFKAWRAKARQAAFDQTPSVDFAPAGPASVGLDANGVSFVSPLRDTGGLPYATALVTTARGFHPAHPFHTGSGDHVNAGHLFDCALQTAHLVLNADVPLRCIGGKAEFKRFIELDLPFTIGLRRRGQTGASVSQLEFLLSQTARENAIITLEVTPVCNVRPRG